MTTKPLGSSRGSAAPPHAAYSILATLIAGLVVWAGAGALLDTLTGSAVFLPVGAAVGVLGSLYLVYVRYGRYVPPGQQEEQR